MNPKPTSRHRAPWSLLWLAYDRGHRHLPNRIGTGKHRAHD